MYLDRLPGLRAQFRAYSVQTRDLKLVWSKPAPVPSVKKSKREDFFFSCGHFEGNKDSSILTVFVMNPNRRMNLLNPHGFMFVHAPYGSIGDMVVIFHTHIREKGMGTLLKEIRVIKGVRPRCSWERKDARIFTMSINQEIVGLFYTAAKSANQAEQDCLAIEEVIRFAGPSGSL